MPKFSTRSLDRLGTCHGDLQDLFKEVVKYFDITITEGHRSSVRQAELYAQGRTGPGQIVTNCDGVIRKSRHQSRPSVAVDVVPYPVDWDNAYRFHELAGWVQCIAMGMGVHVIWGGHWRTIKDLPHWEVDNEMANTDTA